MIAPAGSGRTRPQLPDKGQPGEDQSLIVAHGARSILVTGLVAVMVIVSIAVAPSADLPWHHTALAWAGLALPAFLWSRLAASGGILPIGVHGDSRFIVAAIATFFIAVMSPETVTLIEVPFFLLLLAAGLCGLADGAWIATAMRQLNLPFRQALGAFLRTAGSAWRIETGNRPGDGP